MPLIQRVVQIDLPLYLSQLEDHKGSAMGTIVSALALHHGKEHHDLHP